MRNGSSIVRRTLFGLSCAALFVAAACGDDNLGGVDRDDRGTGGGDTAEGPPDAAMDAGDTEVPPDDAGMDSGGETGDSETDGGSEESGPAMVVATTQQTAEPTTTTVRTVVDFESGTVADERVYETNDMVLDETAGRVFALDRRCSQDPSNCSKAAGVAIELGVDSAGVLSEARTLELPDDVFNPRAAGIASTGGRTFAVSYQTSTAYEYTSPGKPDGTLDLSPFDAGGTEEDDDPEAVDVAIDGGDVYFLLQRLTGFSPMRNSAVAGYDLASDSFIDFVPETQTTSELDLQGTNAAALRRTPEGTLTVALRGQIQTPDGSIVELADEGDGRLSVGSTIVREEQLGGDVSNFALTGERIGFAVVSRSGTPTAVRFDASGSSVETTTLRDLGSGFSSALCLTPDRSEAWFGVSRGSESEFVGFDSSSGSELDESGPTVEGNLPNCAFTEESD